MDDSLEVGEAARAVIGHHGVMVTTAPGEAQRVGFSIIVPTRNEEGFIGRTLRDLRRAREAHGLDLEVIVVDGGSDDATVQEAQGLADVIVVGDERAARSIAHARNVGAENATRPFLFHTDADVLFQDLDALLATARRLFADPRTVAVTAPVMPYPWTATRRDVVIHRVVNAYLRSSLHWGGMFGRGECQIVRASSFVQVGGYQGDFVSGEDCDLFRRLGRLGKVRYVPHLPVHHSTRRFDECGYVRVLGVYLREWAWMTFRRRSYLSEWPVVRGARPDGHPTDAGDMPTVR